MSSARVLRQLLADGRCVVAPGAFDPYSARIIEQLGFPAIYIGGNAIGLQLCAGQPFVTLTETVDAIRRINRAVRVPVLVDAGAGFGDAAHTLVTVRELERAGAAAIHIDDQIYPKRAHYHRGRGRLLDAASVSGKLLAALAGRRDPDFLVIARTDALRVTGSLDATIDRIRLYAQAGIDAAMVLDLGVELAPKVRQALPDLPLIWIGGISEPVPSVAELQDAGFCMAVYPFNTVAAITESVMATWQGLSSTGVPAKQSRPASASVQTALSLVGIAEFWDLERKTTEPDPDA